MLEQGRIRVSAIEGPFSQEREGTEPVKLIEIKYPGERYVHFAIGDIAKASADVLILPLNFQSVAEDADSELSFIEPLIERCGFTIAYVKQRIQEGTARQLILKETGGSIRRGELGCIALVDFDPTEGNLNQLKGILQEVLLGLGSSDIKSVALPFISIPTTERLVSFYAYIREVSDLLLGSSLSQIQIVEHCVGGSGPRGLDQYQYIVDLLQLLLTT